MKICDLINKVDKSENNAEWVNIEGIAGELGLNISFSDDNPSLKSYWLSKTLDTDTHVGLEAFFLNNEFVFLIRSTGRKNGFYYEWASKETKEKVFNYLISISETISDDYTKYVDFEEDFKIKE